MKTSLEFFCLAALFLFAGVSVHAQETTATVLKKLDVPRGIVALVGLPAGGAPRVVDLAKAGEQTLYFQSGDAAEVLAVRQAADAAGLLGVRIFADLGTLDSIHLADNLADGILVAAGVEGKTTDAELLRALRPLATAHVGDRKLTKPVPAGYDYWSHAYHGPDNNPNSTDQYVRGALRTQFLAEPKFSPMPEQTVAAGGRLYKALGHIAHKANQNEMLNTLLCINAYNGTILWKRPNPPGFMIHRNTMIATDDALYMGDHESCKIFDGRTGEIRDQIVVPADLSDGPVWKWMALENGILYALVGNLEIQIETQKSDRPGLGHWPWGMWKGHDYNDPRTAFGYGRTLLAIDLKTKKPLWHYRDPEFLDARAVVMRDGRIYVCSPEKFVAAVDAKTGKLDWKNSDKDLLAAIGPNAKAQHYITGYATTNYMKCSRDYLFFAGPQRTKLVVASTKDGKLAWTHPVGNLQLVIRDDALYAAGPQGTEGMRFEYATGNVLTKLPARRACTRATGCVDSIFFRASGGTVRIMTESNAAEHIAPMRPPCQDGVVISNGHLYWGPWMCGCQLSLYGHICLAPASGPRLDDDAIYRDALETGKNIAEVQPLAISPKDWPTFRANNARSDTTAVAIPAQVDLAWKAKVTTGELPTAPVAAGGLVFVGDRTGAVSAFDADGKRLWKAYTGGPVYYPPTVAHDRVFVGSADGRVYAYEARTGRFLWSFRVAPEERFMPVFGKLISRWPVAGGIVVENGLVYAAAGVAHYDGTYVVALDALTGELKIKNTSSGVVAAQVNNGISLQGELGVVDGELQFLAGGVYETARYDLKTLKCKNEPKVQLVSQFRTAFYPYYPEYGKYVSLDHTCGDGSMLCHDASYEGSVFTSLALRPALPPGVQKPYTEASRWALKRRGENAPADLWQDKANRRFTSFVVSGDSLLATGHPEKTPAETSMTAMNVKTGAEIWRRDLPAEVVKSGTAVDQRGRIVVTLENGELMCFQAK